MKQGRLRRQCGFERLQGGFQVKETLQIFLSYARGDEKKVEALYQKLLDAGFKPWMDKKDILPGKRRTSSIEEAIANSDIFLVCLSANSIDEWGTIKTALEFCKLFDDEIYLIPVRLEECEVPEELSDFQWMDLFEEYGWTRLVEVINRIFTPSLSPPEPPEDLVQACMESECVLYMGAGLSAQAGYPTWMSFVRGLLDWALENEFVEKSFGKSLRAAITAEQSDLVADSIVSELQAKGQEKLLYEYLSGIFLKDPLQLPKAHHVLKTIPFSAALTTNFDGLLEQTYQDVGTRVYTPEDTEPLLEALTKREFFILKLYGTLERPETVLVAPAQYDDAVAGNLPFSQFMESLFFSRTILFVGASLERIETYLGGIKFRGAQRQHYALVAVAGSAWQAKADMLRRRYGIQVLPYALSDNHPEVLEFMKKLAQKVKTETERTGEKEASAGYKRVRLENIGPFDNLELELDQRWNILLGNNGVGKSTIIKAIAVGICGRDAQPYADRLIKIGETRGMITLETASGNKYVTELLRTSREGEAEVESTGRSLKAEGWLAIGFPPLRTVSWERPRGPQLNSGKSRPTTDDLLPLVKSDPDPRLDELKQWIINLDYRIKDERVKKVEDKRYEKLLQEFFLIIGRLTENVTVKFKEVELNTNQIKVITDDGEVPIEAVSQGTTSLIGWIGTLLQRLYEIYGQEDEPREKYALVLIDEIDAHMHPEWQQSLVPNLTELFPNVQFIATTHSPLIVGNSKPCEVFRLRRNEKDSNRVIVERVEEPFQGWRADQILTGPLFGLESTRDLETQKLLMRYTELAARENLSPDERRELEEAANVLKIRIPSSAEREEAREASRMIQQALWNQWNAMPSEKRQKISQEVDAQLQELITTSRRPK